jgi:O-antigen ligase
MLGVIIAGTAFVGGESSLTRITDDQAVVSDVTLRPRIWSNTVRMIAANMPFGVGLGAYGTAYTKFDESSGLDRVDQAHNDFLQTVSDAGIVGLVLGVMFLYLIFSYGRRGVKIENDYRRGLAVGAFAGVLGVLIHSLFDFVLHTTAISLFFLTVLALLVCTLRKYDDDVKNEARERERRKRTSGSSRVMADVRRR